jgi:hypothetical protein
MLFGASALSKDNVWVVGDQEGKNGLFETLAEHWDGSDWTVVPTPDPGGAGNHLYAVDAVSADNVWAVGQSLTGTGPDKPLVEHWDGVEWSAVTIPGLASQNLLLDAVTAGPGGQVWVAGEADSPAGGGQPLIEHYAPGDGWRVADLPALPSGANWANLYGLAVTDAAVWAVGTYVDPVTDNNDELVLRESGGSWHVARVPAPGSGSNLPGGITTIGGHLWLTGVFDDGGSRLPLIATR